jgi:hypothetical protein
MPNFMKIYQVIQKLLVGDRQPLWNDRGHFNVITTIQNFIQIYQSVQKLHRLQKLKRSKLWNSLSYEFKEYGIEVAFNIMTSVQNFIQIQQQVRKLHHRRSLNVRHFGVIDVTFNAITYIENVIHIHQSVQILLGSFFAPTSQVQTSATLEG